MGWWVGAVSHLIWRPGAEVEECHPPPVNLVPQKFSSLEPLLACVGSKNFFFLRALQNLRTELWYLWGQGVSDGDVPPQKWRKNIIFKVNSHNLVHFFLPEAPTQSQVPHLCGGAACFHLKSRGVGIAHFNIWQHGVLPVAKPRQCNR